MTHIAAAAEQAREQARQADGRFGEQHRQDPGDVVPALPPAPLTVDDRVFLSDWRGAFRDGYDESDVARFASGIESVQVGCLWEYIDEYGYGGDSELFGVGPDGMCRPLSTEAWQYLFEDDPDEGESNIPSSLVADEPAWFQLDASLVNATHDDVQIGPGR